MTTADLTPRRFACDLPTARGVPARRLLAVRPLHACGLAVRRLLACTLVAFGLVACGEAKPVVAPHGAITDVVVVLKGSAEPLPFDPRGGRLTKVSRDVAAILGHPIVLELDTALSPELRSSLEESVIGSFETIVRELVVLQREDPAMFEKARGLERVVCRYDAVAKESDGELGADGRVLTVRSPPDRFPLLAPHVLVDAVYLAFVADLDARFGEADPRRLPARERGAYFEYMTSTRPGAGYLWIAARRSGRAGDRLREEHLGRVLALADVVEARSELGAKIRRWLLSQLPYEGAATRAYVAWLQQNLATFGESENLALAQRVFERGQKPLPGFDATAFGFAVYDQWAAGRVHGELEKLVVCPRPRRGEDETEIHHGCSRFFASLFADDAGREALARRAANDPRLLETALLNLGHGQGKEAVALLDLLAARSGPSFHAAARVLFHDHARRDDVRDALEGAAARWWRDLPAERGFALLVMGRRNEHLHPLSADGQWTRWTPEFGGPVKGDVMTRFLGEGPRAVEMVPNMWLAFAKGPERDELVARSLPVLLERDRVARTSRATKPLNLLRSRLCAEQNAAGLAVVRASIERWAKERSDAPSSVSNAIADFTLSRCAKPPPPDDADR